ncbi:MAG TPA: cellulose biosynthesis protein BcsS, partial [Methylophaga sp.]|nr:cellulose biosynthesis protein BcsS [Methylophaga sp.]
SIGPQSQFNRLRLGYRPTGMWHVGLEGMYQEGKSYRIKQYGLFATHYFASGLSLELHGGTLESQDTSGAAYLGAAFSKSF